MAPVAHLQRLGHAHYEYVLLRYCLCTKPMHLLRMVGPEVHDAANSVSYMSGLIRHELGRIVGEGLDLLRWEQAQQPTGDMGLGLQNYSLIQGAAFVASHGGVARLIDRCLDLHGDTRPFAADALAVVASRQKSDQPLARTMQALADRVNASDDAHPLCPTIDLIATVPKQSTLVKRLYDRNAEAILGRVLRPSSQYGQAHLAHLKSCRGFNAGRRFDAVPSLPCFKTATSTFRSMLRFRLFMDDPAGPRLGATCPLCTVGAPGFGDAAAIRSGRHYLTQCDKCDKCQVHNRLKWGPIRELYVSLGVPSFVEPGACYAGANDKPADIGLPSSVHGTRKLLALDIGLVDPTSTCYRGAASRTPLKAARKRENDKLNKHRRAVETLGETAIDCELIPLIFETTGAFGQEARRWWEKFAMPLAAKRELTNQCLSTLPGAGSDPNLLHTWTANTWPALMLQKIDWMLGVALAEKAQGKLAMAVTARLNADYHERALRSGW